MLGGLGKELRRCGVDCLILDNNVEHVEVARVSNCHKFDVNNLFIL